MEVVRQALEEDPKALKTYVQDRVRKGADIRRGLMLALETLYAAEDQQRIEEPHTFDEFRKLDRDERRQLLRQLEAEGRAEPFSADAWRAQQRSGTAAEP